MAIQPYKPDTGGLKSKAAGAFSGAEAGSVAGPYGAIIGGILGAARSGGSSGGAVAQIGLNELNKDAYQRRMDTITKGDPSNPADPAHQENIQSGLDALPHSGLPQEQQDHIASILIAGQTHGPGGYSTDHLFNNEPGQSYLDQSTGD